MMFGLSLVTVAAHKLAPRLREPGTPLWGWISTFMDPVLSKYHSGRSLVTTSTCTTLPLPSIVVGLSSAFQALPSMLILFIGCLCRFRRSISGSLGESVPRQ